MGYREVMGTSARVAEPQLKHLVDPEQLAAEQAALRRVATLVASGASSEDVFSAVAQEVAQVMSVPMVGVWRYDRAEATATVTAGWSDRPHVLQPGTRWPLDGPSMVKEVLETGRPAKVEEYEGLPGAIAAGARESGLNRTAGAPIVVDGSIWGVMGIASPDWPLPEQAEHRLAQFTDLVGAAIANGQAHDELTRLAEEQAALRRVATLVAAGARPTEVFEAVSTEVAALIPAEGSALTRFEADGTVTAVSGWTADQGYTYVGRRYPLEGTVSGVIFETGRPGRVDNYSDRRGEAIHAAREMGWRSSVGAPVTVDGRLWGVLALASMSETPLPGDTEQRLAKFTELVATAIANSEAHEELARLVDEQAALRRVAMLAARGAPPVEVFESVSEEVAGLFRVDAGAVMRYEPDGTVVAAGGWTASDGHAPTGMHFTLEGSLSGLILETGRPARIDDFDCVKGETATALREMGWQSAAGAPISVEGSLWGTLVVYSLSAEPFPLGTEERLAKFGEIVATAIANTESRQEITRLADEQAALRRVATLVAQGAQPAEVFEAVSAEVGRLVPADVAAISRFDAGETVTTLGAWTRAGGYQLQTGEQFALEPGTTGRLVYDTHRPARRDNYESITAKRGVNPAFSTGIAVPIIVEGRLWGVAQVASTTDPLPADTEQRLMQFTELLATAIANSEAHEELALVALEQAALRRVATLAANGAPPAEIVDAVSVEVARLIGADGAAVTRFADDGTFMALGGWSRSGDYEFTGVSFELEGSMSGVVYETSRPGRIDTFEGRPGEAAAAMRASGWCSAAGAPIAVEGRLWGALVVYSKETEPLLPETERRLGEFSEIVAAAIANTESRAKITRLADEQAALRRVATLVAQGVRPVEIFSAVSDELGRLFGSEQAAIGRFEPDGSAVVVVGASGGIQGVSVGTRWPLEDFLASTAVYRTGRTARTDQGVMEDASGPVADTLRQIGFLSTVAAPIHVEGHLWGVMTLSDRREPLPPDTEERVENFTELVATAIANAESRGELEASRARIVATADATRRRIERDLHDGAQQRLLSLALELRAAQASMPSELTTQRAELSHVAEGMTNVLDGLREIALGLHPAILAEGGLAAALKTLAQRSPIPVVFDCEAEGRLPEHVEVAAYYVVSEALTNAAKHSGASKVEVEVTVHDDVLRVAVGDDGLGGAVPERGSGLLGLKDRAAAIGGTLSLQSRAGEGTSLVAELPLAGSSS